MRKAKGSKEISSQLRKKAEKLLHGRLDEWELNTEGASALLHELRVHQLELEMQNEELQQAYQTHEEARNKYAELYQFAPVGYFTIDEKGLILDVNLTGAMMLGGQRNDFIKKRFYDFLVREDRDQFYLHLRKADTSKQRQSSDLQLTKIHGGSFYAQIQSVFMAGPDDASSYYLTLISDITQRKQAQDALYEAKREAERSNAAKTRFLAAASHDLRQPLQTISLLIGVLEKTLKISDPNIKDVLANLSETMNDMGGLLNTLLDISRLEGGGVVPRLAELPIDKLFRRLETHFARRSMEKGIQLRLVPSRLVVQSDAALLERVLQNLLSNAIRHTEKGKILLGCRRRGAKLRIEVWDTGPGIPADQQSKIFEDYYQLENPARDRRKGLGLGLAIVERTTRLLNHPIEVRSTVGKGSVFAVEVPILHRHPTEDEPSPEQNSEALAVSVVTILLIEDEEPHRAAE